MMTALGRRLIGNPYPLYAILRRLRPIFRLPLLGHWALFDYESVKRALSDHDAFSSDVSAAGFGTLGFFIFFDPPRHTRIRGLLSRAFTSQSIANLEPRIRELAHALLDPQQARGSMELVSGFAAPLPLMVIAEMLGVPSAEWQTFRRWSGGILGLATALNPGPKATQALGVFRRVHEEIQAYLAPLFARRREAPRDDLLTRLVQAEVDGERLTEEEMVGFFELLLFAGNETTTNLIGSAVLCLLEHPVQLARLREEPGLWPSAIEEVLRYRSPAQAVFRVARRDVALRGRLIPAGRLVLPMIGSANRDPQKFEQPSRFDIARTPNAHVAFGQGIHFCIAAQLARLEARVALPVLFDRLPGLALAPRTPWTPRQQFPVHGPDRLAVRFRTARPGASP